MSFTSAWGITISDERGSLEVSLPSGWRYEKNFLALPHVLLSPEVNRASFSITVTGIQDVKLPSLALEKNQTDYQDGRKKWAEKRDFIITQFIPYTEKTFNNVRTHSIGFIYKDKKSEYLEMSYYTECPKTLVHTKALGILGTQNLQQAQTIISSLKCL